MKDIAAVAVLLGQNPIRHTSIIVELWKKKLKEREPVLLKGYEEKSLVSDEGEPFAKLWITPDLMDLNGLQDLDEVKGKVLHKCFVKIMNKATLCDKTDNVWRQKLESEDGITPIWKVLYKPPLMKKNQVMYSGEF